MESVLTFLSMESSSMSWLDQERRDEDYFYVLRLSSNTEERAAMDVA